MDEDLLPIGRVAEMLDRHLRLPAGWDDAERQEFIDEAAEQVALRRCRSSGPRRSRGDGGRVAVTTWGRPHHKRGPFRGAWSSS